MHHQHETRRTEPALERAAIDERLLHDRQRAAGIERFNSGNGFTVDPRREIETTGYCFVVYQHGAATAQTLPAALARAEQIEALQQLDQIAMRLDLGRNRPAVEREIDGAHTHLFTPGNNIRSFPRKRESKKKILLVVRGGGGGLAAGFIIRPRVGGPAAHAVRAAQFQP